MGVGVGAGVGVGVGVGVGTGSGCGIGVAIEIGLGVGFEFDGTGGVTVAMTRTAGAERCCAIPIAFEPPGRIETLPTEVVPIGGVFVLETGAAGPVPRVLHAGGTSIPPGGGVEVLPPGDAALACEGTEGPGDPASGSVGHDWRT